jgi:hypothetical protein
MFGSHSEKCPFGTYHLSLFTRSTRARFELVEKPALSLSKGSACLYRACRDAQGRPFINLLLAPLADVACGIKGRSLLCVRFSLLLVPAISSLYVLTRAGAHSGKKSCVAPSEVLDALFVPGDAIKLFAQFQMIAVIDHSG